MKANIKYHEEYITKLNKSKGQLKKQLKVKNLIKREIIAKLKTINEQLQQANVQFDLEANKIHDQQGKEYHLKVLVNQKIYERDVEAFNLEQIADQKANLKQLEEIKNFVPNDQEAIFTLQTIEKKKNTINKLQQQKKEFTHQKFDLKPLQRQIRKLQYDEQHYRYMLSDIEAQIENTIAALSQTDELIYEQQREINHCKFQLATEIVDEFHFRK